MKKVKKVLVILCTIAIVLSSFMLVGCDKDAGNGDNGGTNTETNSNTNTDISTYVRVDADGNESADGKYILFGSYPQSKVTDETVSAALTEAAGALPTKESDGNWTSYGYDVVISVVAGDGSAEEPVNVVASKTIKIYSWYIDREYNGARYRGIYFLDYRPISLYDCSAYTESWFSSEEEMNEWLDSITQEWLKEKFVISPEEDYTPQALNGYTTGSVYWFKYEPIKWRILEEKDGKAFLMSDTALYSRELNDIFTYNHKKITEDDWYFYCNYAASDLRKWLNGSFYNDAFSDGQKDMIAVTTVSNGKDSYWDEDYAMYWCEDTEDKVFLLSENEVIDDKYGFAADDPFETKDTARRLQASDYALGNGCYSGNNGNELWDSLLDIYLYREEVCEVKEGCYWRIRSLGAAEISDDPLVSPDGNLYGADCTGAMTFFGIAPVIWLNL